MIEVHCGECGEQFQVSSSLAGGKTNCPHCRALVDVRSGHVGFWGLVVLAAIFVLAVAVVVGISNPEAGITIGVIGLTVIGIVVFAM